MKRYAITFLLAIILALPASAQPVPPTPKPVPVDPKPSPSDRTPLIQATVALKAGRPVLLDASTAKGKVKWRLDFDSSFAVVDGKKLFFSSPYNGTYKVLAISFDDGTDDSCTITVTDGQPIPEPPQPPVPELDQITKLAADFKVFMAEMRQNAVKVESRLTMLEQIKPIPPPGPPPGPPVPPPTPAPIQLPGFRVLIVYDQATLTVAQKGIMSGKKVRDYLQAKCVVGADGKTKDFWILQTGVDVSAAPTWIGNVIQRHPGQLFMVVSDGKTGYDGPIPASADEALAVMQKIGGP